jgi:putative membrane protein
MTWIAYAPGAASLADTLSAAAAGASFPIVPAFSWSDWPWHVPSLIAIAVVTALYVWAMRSRRDPQPEPARWVAFAAAQLLLFASLNGPLHRLSDQYLFSVHMVQHLILTEIWAALMLLSLPRDVMGRLLDAPGVGPVLTTLTRPVTAFVLFNLGFALWHLPAMYDLMMRNRGVHELTHLHFMVSGLLMWWPVMEEIPGHTRLAARGHLQCMETMNVQMMPVSAYITLRHGVHYPWYASAPRLFGLSPYEDQQLGGLIMWLPGSIPFWFAMSVVYFRWALAQEAEELSRLHPGRAAEG